VTIYQVNKNSSSAAATTEVEAAAQESADWGAFTERIQKHMDYQDQQIQHLRAEVKELKAGRQADAAYNDLLIYWIWHELGPPPPKPGDPYPDDQVGG